MSWTEGRHYIIDTDSELKTSIGNKCVAIDLGVPDENMVNTKSAETCQLHQLHSTR